MSEVPRTGSPAMLEGMLAPRSVQMESVPMTPTRSVPELPPLTDSYTVYMSGKVRDRVQLTAPATWIGPDGRKMGGGPMLVAQFDNHVFRNNHHDPAIRALIDQELQRNKYFGKFGGGDHIHYWLASDQKAKTESAKLESAKRTLASLPREALEAALAELKAGEKVDHELPVIEKKSAKPIAGA